MPNDELEKIQRKINELTDNLDSLQYIFRKKTGPGSNDIQGSNMQSVNFVKGSTGWQLDKDGNLEANNGNFRGDITGASGTFSGTVTATALNIPDATTANSMHVDSSGNAWWGTNVATGYATATAKILNTGAATFSNVTISGYSLVTGGTFGGDGSEGSLTLTNTTANYSFGSTTFLIKNFTSISITGTGKVTFTNPATQGSAAIIKSQGAVTLTASATIIDMSAMGAAGGAAVTAAVETPGNPGTAGAVSVFQTNYGGRGNFANTGSDPALGLGPPSSVLYPTSFDQTLNRYPLILCGAGGGSGSAGNNSSSGTSGTGGRGGGALIIECAGAWNFTTASGISVAGGNGGTGSGAGSSGGGGGGAGGFLLVLYKTLTASSGTVVTTGGTGGNSSVFTDYGGGGGALIASGTPGTFAGAGVKSGGDGAAGVSTITTNLTFA